MLNKNLCFRYQVFIQQHATLCLCRVQIPFIRVLAHRHSRVSQIMDLEYSESMENLTQEPVTILDQLNDDVNDEDLVLLSQIVEKNNENCQNTESTSLSFSDCDENEMMKLSQEVQSFDSMMERFTFQPDDSIAAMGSKQ